MGDDEALEEIEELEHDKDRDEVVRAAKGDPGAAEKAQARLLELQNKLDAAEEKLNSPSQVNFVKSSSQSLPLGTRLEEFLIEKMLGSGGCGITYLARDTRLERQVVVKENLPVQLCYRDTHSLTVAPRHTVGEDAENFAWSLENFSKEAVMLASLEHPGIVRVLRSFEALGTAYFVMPFVEGRSLDELLKERGGRPFAEGEAARSVGEGAGCLGIPPRPRDLPPGHQAGKPPDHGGRSADVDRLRLCAAAAERAVHDGSGKRRLHTVRAAGESRECRPMERPVCAGGDHGEGHDRRGTAEGE